MRAVVTSTLPARLLEAAYIQRDRGELEVARLLYVAAINAALAQHRGWIR